MGRDNIKENIERIKLLAQDFLDRDIRIFIKDVNSNFYFADILLVGDDGLTVQCFAPIQRKNEKITINWFSIVLIEEYKEGGR